MVSSEIAKWLDRNSNTITLIIDRMIKEGLVERGERLKDRRKCSLVMTQKGLEFYNKASRLALELSQELMAALSEEELATLSSLLGKVRERTFQIRRIQEKVADIVIDKLTT